MNDTTASHPDEILRSLEAMGFRSDKIKNLRLLHDICKMHFKSKSKDFSLPTIGKLCAEQGVFLARVLYNKKSDDYRTLIAAWGAHAGPMVKVPKAVKNDELLDLIDDAVIRSLVQALIIERNLLKQERDTLKQNANFTIDMRPIASDVVFPDDGPAIAIITPVAQMTASERQALERAISSEFLDEQGWIESKLGEIANSRGRTIFLPGFTTAIRKILGG